MAVKRDSRYPGRWTAADSDFPLGGPKNRTTTTSQDGSYFNRDFIADYEAFFQRLMTEGGVVVNETVDTAPTSQFYTALERTMYKNFLFMGFPISTVGYTPNPDVWLPAGRVELLRSEYQTVFEIVSIHGLTDQATIDANPRSYAGHWGTGDGATTFTTDDWALMMNIKVAGGYGVAGSTKEDHIQNITGSLRLRASATSSGGAPAKTAFVATGSFYDGNAVNAGSDNAIGFSPSIGYQDISFNAANVVKTDPDITDSMGLFLDHYRVIPKGTFSYA